MQRIRGTRDILYTEVQYWRLIVEKARSIFESAQYQKICTPIIENTSLFTKSIGQSTDIISKEMYNFRDQGDRNVTLRPEGTASIVRAVIENKLYRLNLVNRFWYYGPMFRYERPQSGRQRQFHQLGIECFGSTSPRADAEVIYLAVELLKKLKYTEFNLEINSIGNLTDRIRYQEELKNYLLPYIGRLDNDSVRHLYTNPLRILDSKDLYTQEILSDAPRLYNFLDIYSKQHFENVCCYLSSLKIPYLVNNKLVRGLDYYNNTAFEIKTVNTEISQTLCGGGRYDSLTYQLGRLKTPAVGWAIGLERLYYLLKNKIDFLSNGVDVYIASQGQYADQYALFVMRFLNDREFTTVLDLNSRSLKKQLKRANKVLARACFIIGNREMFNKTITIKWLNDGQQEIFQQDFLQHYVQYLRNRVSSVN